MRQPQYFRRFDYDPRLLPNAQLRAMEEGVTDVETARTRTGLTIGYPGWGLIYYTLLNHLHWDRPNHIIETGSNWGCSTIVLAQAVKDSRGGGSVRTVEISPDNASKAKANIEAAGLSDVTTIYEGDSLAALPTMLADLDEVRVAFLDGSHAFDHVMAEFALVVKKLSPTGMVLMDNTYGLFEGEADERVFGALKAIKAHYGGNIVNFERTSWYTPGLAIWQR